MHIWIHSSSRITAVALAELVRELGFEPTTEREPMSEVALWDLSDSTAPDFPPPPSLSTLALLPSAEAGGAELFGLGYRGYLTDQAESRVLEQALNAVFHGQLWAGDRPLSSAQPGQRRFLDSR